MTQATTTTTETQTVHVSPPAPKPPHAGKKSNEPLSADEISFIVRRLKDTPMFRQCSPADLQQLASGMRRVQYQSNEYLVRQDDHAEEILVISDGEARRTRLGRDGVERHLFDTNTTINSLTITSPSPIYSSAKCISDSCSAYALDRRQFHSALASTPSLSTGIIRSLSDEVRQQTLRFRTPLLQQRKNTELNFSAVAVSATVESYYRSALNAVLNRQLTGNQTIPLFPAMHIQVPARIAYITGFKALRAWFDRAVDIDELSSASPGRAQGLTLLKAISPGIIMTPIASLLEACNVGHINSEPILRRCTRGFLPRGGREIIFGVGLNQLSDYFEERYRTLDINPVIANSLGSVTAGVAAGYFSHVPHNVSTLKMLHPEKSYKQIFRSLVEKSPAPPALTRVTPKPFAGAVRTAWACLVPKGVFTRTVQICGSFAILNGIILLIEGDNRRRMRKAMEARENEFKTDTKSN